MLPKHKISMTAHNKKLFAGSRTMDEMSIFGHMKIAWQFFFAENDRVPAEQLPLARIGAAAFTATKDKQLQVHWLGHSSLLINIEGHTILTDPLFERKVSLFGPTRFHSELPLAIEEKGIKVDVVLISHDHYDHLNKFTMRYLADKTGLFLVPRRVGKRLVKWGIPQEKIVELGWWEEYSPSSTLTLVATPSHHFSGRGLTDRNATLWTSWVMFTPEHRVYFSGDSGYFPGFKKIGEKYGPFDMTFLECGAYNERWSNVHMFPEQTVAAHLDLTGKILQPLHWATFNLSFHPWYEPMERLTSAAAKAGVRISTPIIGELVDFNNLSESRPWWRSAMAGRLRTKNTTLFHKAVNHLKRCSFMV
jgi:L-ascorbate metabolism protein UlaG (beta-lactamase superfamily)